MTLPDMADIGCYARTAWGRVRHILDETPQDEHLGLFKARPARCGAVVYALAKRPDAICKRCEPANA
jgi:hypothetical protein